MNEKFIKDGIKEISDLSDVYKFDEALTLCNKFIKEYSYEENIESIFIFNKGLIYERMTQYSKAIEFYEESFKKSNNVQALLREYDIFMYLNDLTSALETIDKIISSSPTSFYGYDLKFNFLFKLGVYDEAEKILKLIEDTFEDSSIITINKVRLYVMTKRYEEAFQIIDKERENEDIKYDLLVEKAKILTFKENIQGAVKILKDVEAKFQDNVDLIYLTGSLYMISWNMDIANSYFRKLLNLPYEEKMSYLLGLYFYGITLKHLENEEKVKEYFQWLMRKYSVYGINNPNDLNGLILKGAALYELEKYDEALKLMIRIEAINSEIVETKLIKALIYKKTNNIDEYEKVKALINKKSELLSKSLEVIEKGEESNE